MSSSTSSAKNLFFLGATRTEDVKELIHARQSVVVHAKAYGLQAIDMVYINFKGNLKICPVKKKMHALRDKNKAQW